MKHLILAGAAVVALLAAGPPAHAEWFSTGVDVAGACAHQQLACWGYLTGILEFNAVTGAGPRICVPPTEDMFHVALNVEGWYFKDPKKRFKEDALSSTLAALAWAYPCK
jgi:hypothetical protein